MTITCHCWRALSSEDMLVAPLISLVLVMAAMLHLPHSPVSLFSVTSGICLTWNKCVFCGCSESMSAVAAVPWFLSCILHTGDTTLQHCMHYVGVITAVCLGLMWAAHHFSAHVVVQKAAKPSVRVISPHWCLNCTSDVESIKAAELGAADRDDWEWSHKDEAAAVMTC